MVKAKKLVPIDADKLNLFDKYALVNLTLCEQHEQEFHDLKCSYRECLECGVHRLRDLIIPDEVQPK